MKKIVTIKTYSHERKQTRQKIALSSFFVLSAGIFFTMNQKDKLNSFLDKTSVIDKNDNSLKEFSFTSLTPRWHFRIPVGYEGRAISQETNTKSFDP